MRAILPKGLPLKESGDHLISGVHLLHHALTARSSVEPRAAIRDQPSTVRAFTLGAGLRSRTESIMT